MTRSALMLLQSTFVRIACVQRTTHDLRVLRDSAERSRTLPPGDPWDRKVAAHAEFHCLLADAQPRRSPSSRDVTEMNVRRVIHGFILASAARVEAPGLGLLKAGGCPVNRTTGREPPDPCDAASPTRA